MDIDEAIGLYCECDREFDDYGERAYPSCIGFLDGVVAIADEDSNGSNLSMYRADTFIDWMKDIQHYRNNDPTADIRAAFYETKPEPDYYESH